MIRVVKYKISVRFSNIDSALKFAEKVKGKVNDLTCDPNAKSKYSVTFDRIERPYTKSGIFKKSNDFNYPNEFWQ